MPREDWKKNPVHMILRKNGLWPFADDDRKTVLDVACGLSLKSQYLPNAQILGVDIHEPYLRAIDFKGKFMIAKCNVRFLDCMFLPESFDLVYALDIIEHLTKQESKELIRMCKSICRQAVVIETPNGYIPQDMDIQGFGADHLQTHRCGWSVKELKELGFKCVVRDYMMSDVKRHTKQDVDPNIELIDGIYLK